MKFVIKHPASGKWATYDMRSGPRLTDNPSLRYTWEDRESAEGQRKLYEQALGVGLLVAEAGPVTLTVLSPDGVPVAPFEFASRADAEAFIDGWVERYRAQGYYAAADGSRIQLSELRSHLKIQSSE